MCLDIWIETALRKICLREQQRSSVSLFYFSSIETTHDILREINLIPYKILKASHKFSFDLHNNLIWLVLPTFYSR